MRRLLRIRNARIYLFGDFVSTLGDSALWLAMAIWMKELTGSSAAAGLVMFAFAAGNLFSPLGGALADRFRRRPLLIWLNLAAAALVLFIVLVQQRSQIWIVYVVIFLYGVIGSAISPAQTALLPALAPADLLAEANGAQQTLNQGLRLITPLVGAGLFALVGGAVIAEIDAATFIVAVISLLALRVTEPEPEHRTARPGEGNVSAGFRFIGREPVLRSVTIALALAMLAFGFTESAAFSVVTVGLHHSASFVGVLMTTQGIGAVAGGLSAAAILRRVSEGMMTAMGLACAAAAVLLLTLPSVLTALAGMIIAGFVGPWVGVAAITAIQRRSPSALMGRVTGAFELGLTVPQVLSVGLGAALIAVLNYRALLVIVALVAAAAVSLLLSNPAVRRGTAGAATVGDGAGSTATASGPSAATDTASSPSAASGAVSSPSAASGAVSSPSAASDTASSPG
jgi:MFS family permease